MVPERSALVGHQESWTRLTDQVGAAYWQPLEERYTAPLVKAGPYVPISKPLIMREMNLAENGLLFHVSYILAISFITTH